MEKDNNLESPSYIESTIQNVLINPDITLDKVQQLMSKLDKITKYNFSIRHGSNKIIKKYFDIINGGII